MTGELSAILDHIEKISALDLDGVPPTSHVVEVPNALRPDEPRPSLPRDVALRQRARDRRRGLLRPEPDGMSDVVALTAAQAARRRREGRPRRARAVRGLPRPRGRRRPQRVRVGRRTRPRAANGAAAGAARRRPARRQGPLLHRGRPVAGRLEDPRGLPPAVHGDRRAQARRGRRAAARQDEPGRVRDGLVERELRLRARCSTRGTARACPAARAAAAPPRSPPASCRGRSAPTPAARSASPPRCAGSSASSRRTAPCSRFGMIAFASSLDQAGPLTRDVTDAALLFRHMVGRDDRDATSVAFPEEVRLPTRRAPRRHPPRRARRPHRRGRRARRDGALRGDAGRRARPRRDRRARLAAARRLRPQRLLRARAGRGVVEPRALRRRPLRAAARRDRTC